MPEASTTWSFMMMSLSATRHRDATDAAGLRNYFFSAALQLTTSVSGVEFNCPIA